MEKIFRSVWFSWVFTTIIYLTFNFFGYPGSVASSLGYVAGFVGLFVPYGFASSSVLLRMPLTWISVVVFIVLMVLVDKNLNKQNFSLGKRIFLNFLALLVLTIIVDNIRGTPFFSWIIFFDGALPHFSL